MPIQLHARAEKDFTVPGSERDGRSPVFRIGVIPGWEMPFFIQKLYGGELTTPEKDGAFRRELLRAGLRGWEGLTGADGADVPFVAGTDGRATAATLALIANDPLTVTILAQEILNHNTLREEDLGNLNSPSKSPSGASPTPAELAG